MSTPRSGPHVCPACGERVTAFAAGCAWCGAGLDPRRTQGASTVGQRMQSAWRARPRLIPRIPVPSRRR